MLLAQPTEDLNHSLWAIFRTLEIAHTVLIWVAIWDYFVTNFGNPVYIDHIPPLVRLAGYYVYYLSDFTYVHIAEP